MMTDRLTAFCATHVIPEGVGIRDDLIRFKITRKPLRVLGNGNVRGIDLNHYVRTENLSRKAADIRNYYRIPDDGFAFIFVGRLDRDKGIDELVQAFRMLEKEYPKVHLFLVGIEEPEGKSILDETREIITRDDHIHLSDGWQADVRPWYAAADALVHPSRREGFPNVVIEAGAMGLSSIVTDINGSREIVKDGQNGKIVPAQDPEALYAAMKEFLEQPEMVREMAAAARDLAGRYEQNYVRQCLDIFYREVLR